ncbi:MAG: extracellular solute-binding protein [Pseudomonadota bacterium]
MGYVNDMLEKRREFLAGKIDRRQFNQALAAVGLTTTAFPMHAAMAQSGDHPTVFTWSGYEEEAFVASYVNLHGTAPDFSFFADEEEAYAKLRSGFPADVIMPCTYKVPPWYRAGLLAPIDTSRLTHWNDIVPSLKNIPGTVFDDQHYFVPQDFGFTAITFRHDLAPEYLEPENASWGFLWDANYSGRLSMIDSLIDGVAVASIYGGFNPFDMNELEIEETKKLLQEQLPLLRYYAGGMSDVEQSLAAGELVASATWNGSRIRLLEQGVPVTFMKPDQPALNGNPQGPMTWVCGICLSATMDPSLEQQAYDVMDAYMSPEAGFYEVTEWAAGHANNNVYEMIDEELLLGYGLAKNPDEVLSKGIFQEEMKQEARLQEMFEEVKAGM